MVNLALAAVWIVVGIALLVFHAMTGDERGRIPMFGNISLGWLALMLGAYNFARWWNQRLVAADQRVEWQERARRGHRPGPPPEYGEPNPDFMFGDEPPKKK